MASRAVHLDYAQTGAHARRSAVARRWLVRALVAATLLLAARFGVIAFGHARLIQSQQACLAQRPQTGQTVYDAAAGISLANADWTRFYALLSPPGSRHAATLFVGPMRRGDGPVRLVAIETTAPLPNADGSRSAAGLSLTATVIDPGGAWHRPRLLSDRAWVVPSPDAAGATFLAGRVDPKNPAHVTIPAQAGTRPCTIDAYLGADDRVVFELRDEGLARR
ncbi:MAG TPA: hypothetical protein VEA69_10990 [Tepidisphaeraceae bacterium]|nr:hypothetical protein [Tepidisphaeraceae bacterium]